MTSCANRRTRPARPSAPSEGGGIAPTGNPNKAAILQVARPNFTGNAANMNCGQNRSRDHTLSWQSIRNGYYAALNPSNNTTCANNLGLLYDSVGLARNNNDIAAACANNNITNNNVTQADTTVLSNLNSSTANLRCGYSGPNQSVGGALDVPCGDQAYANNRIEITGNTATQIAAFLSIGTTVPQPFSVFKTNQACNGGGGCSNTRLQTSDCSNDVGAQNLPASNAPVVYRSGNAWVNL